MAERNEDEKSRRRRERKAPEVEAPKIPVAPAKPSDGAGLAQRMTSPSHSLDTGSAVKAPSPPSGGAAAPTAAATETSPAGPPLSPTADTRELLKRLKDERRLKLEAEMGEAHELERRAREIAQRVRQQQKLRTELAKHSEFVSQFAPSLGYDPKRPITVIPPLPGPQYASVEFTTIQEGASFLRVLFDSARNQYLYEVIEPQLMETERQAMEFIRDTLVRTMEARPPGAAADYEAYLVASVERTILDHAILVDDISKQRILYYLVRDFLGYGPVDVLMRDPMIEDVSCDGPNIPVYVFHRQYESTKTNLIFPDEHALDSFVIRLAQRSGKHISIADPLLDATLPDGSRLQATLSKEVTTRGSSFTIRRFRADPLTPPDLIRLGTMTPQMAAYFWFAMAEGKSILFAGGTASGKTTTLNATSIFIPPQKKIVSIEDTREINLRHENWIAGLTRSGFTGELVGGKPAGAIDMYRLLEAALRQRPEYLIVGEVRGPEAVTLFQAMATGHATYSTVHADSVPSVIHRLENEPINVPRIMLQTLDIVAIQVQVRINHRMTRRIKEVVEIIGLDPASGDLLTNTVFTWDPATDKHVYNGASKIFDEVREKENLSPDELETEWKNRTLVLDWMMRKGVRRIDDVAELIAEYYERPDQLMAKVRNGMKTSAMAEGARSGA